MFLGGRILAIPLMCDAASKIGSLGRFIFGGRMGAQPVSTENIGGLPVQVKGPAPPLPSRFQQYVAPILQGAAAGAAAAPPSSTGLAAPGFAAQFLGGFGAARQAEEDREERQFGRQLKVQDAAENRARLGIAQDAEQRTRQEHERRARLLDLQTKFLEDGPEGGFAGILPDLGEQTPNEKARLGMARIEAILSGSVKPLGDEISALVARREIDSADVRGEILPTEAAKGLSSSKSLPDSEFVQAIRDRKGNLKDIRPFYPMRKETLSTGEIVVFDNRGQMFRVPKITTSSSVNVPSRSRSTAGTSVPRAAVPLSDLQFDANQIPPKLNTEGWNPSAIVPTDDEDLADIRAKTVWELQPKGLRKLPSTSQAKLDLYATILSDIRVSKKLAEENSGYLGVISGPFAQTRAAVAGSERESILGVPPRVMTMRAIMLSLQDRQLRERSGAQINEAELKRIAQFSPNPDRTRDWNLQRLRLMEQTVLGQIQQILGRSSFPGRASAPANTPKPTHQYNPSTGKVEPMPGRVE